MKKFFSSLKFTSTSMALVIVSQMVLSCVPTSSNGVRGRSSSGSSGNATVGISQGRILKDNPIILSGNPNLGITADLANTYQQITLLQMRFYNRIQVAQDSIIVFKFKRQVSQLQLYNLLMVNGPIK